MADNNTPTAHATGSQSPPPVLEAANITKTYDSWLPFTRTVDVLTGVDLTLYPGEITGIVGENGAGKSTLMEILVGALEPDTGTVTRHAPLGWCPQDTLLYDRLTVDETFNVFGAAYGLTQPEIDAAVADLADQLDFAEFRDYRINQLSGGNRQKVNLAVALLHNPDLLLLDEPYTGFDWETYLAFWDVTETLVEEDVGIAIISHFVNDRERFDRLLKLEDGELTSHTPTPTNR